MFYNSEITNWDTNWEKNWWTFIVRIVRPSTNLDKWKVLMDKSSIRKAKELRWIYF